ncbi:MAG TPA: WGR domain-containing protein [Desulfobulbaceae bacterium]|nr:WGR domain-containing protein [Desulfobulbaceae bacterium]
MSGFTTTRFECIDPAKNKKAFYTLSTGHGLFCFMLIRCWGRIGGRGHRLTKCFASEAEMLLEYERLCRKRRQRRYSLTD